MLKVDLVLWLVAALLPGVSLIRLCWPDAGRLRTVACAPPVSFGFCYAIGLGSSRLSVSPVPAVLVASGVAAFAAVLVDLRRWRSTAGRRTSPRPADRTPGRRPVRRLKAALGQRPASRLLSWLLLATGIGLGVLQWRSFQSTMLVPVGWDAMHHGYFIEQISRFHTMKPSIVLASSSTGHDGSGTFYPLAFNLVAAVLHVSTGGAISTIMLASTAALAGVLLPLGSYALATELDPNQPLVAGVSAITSVLPMLLYLIEGTGRLTGILGVALVPGLVVLLLSQRRAVRWSTMPLAILGVVGIVGLHTSEAPMAVLVAAACMLVWIRQDGDVAAFRRWLGWVLGAGAIALLALIVLEPNVLHLVSERGGAIVPPMDRPSRQVVTSAFAAVGQAWVFPVLGCAATLLARWRRYRGVTISLVLFMLLFFLIGIGIHRIVPTLAIPWYGDPGRLSWDLTVLGAIPTAIGLVALGGLIAPAGASIARFITGIDRAGAHRVLSHRIERWAAPVVAALAAVLLLIAFTLPPVGREGQLVSQVGGPVDQNSVAAFKYLASQVSPNEPVLDDLRTDGAMWMYIDHGVTTLFGNSPLLGAAPRSWLERLWLSRNLKYINSDPCVRALLDKYSIRFIYAGDARMLDGWAHFNTISMRKDPTYSLVFRQGGANVFVINPGTPPGTCNRDVTTRVRWG